MVNLYKSKILGYLECKTAAIYHASKSLLLRVDRIQDTFLKSAGITELEALCEYRLAPLAARRDMGMLGLIHRTVLGCGPKQFQKFFKLDATLRSNGREAIRRHNRQLQTYRRDRYLDIEANSIIGCI